MQLGVLKTILGGGGGNGAISSMRADEAIRHHGNPEAVFVDVRSHGEIAASGTISGAVRAPLNELTRHARPEGGGALPAIAEQKRIFLVCASGARSGVAASQLAAMGYTDVINIGGFGAWMGAGGPVER